MSAKGDTRAERPAAGRSPSSGLSDDARVPDPYANGLRVEAGVLDGESRALLGALVDVRPLATRIEQASPAAATYLRLAWAQADRVAAAYRRQARRLEEQADLLDPPRDDR